MTCVKCGKALHPSFHRCPACGKDNGPPHVRHAQAKEEREALKKRVSDAWAHAAISGSVARLAAFHAKLSDSQAVMVRALSVIDRMTLKGDQADPITSFYNLRDSGRRTPRTNFWDENRESQDSRINPHYYRNINFAVLSLDGMGPRKYGDVHITWKEMMIDDRSSIFEENPFRFNRRFPIETYPVVPLGYRASWPDRGDLAIAKLHSRILPTTGQDEFAAILVEPAEADDTDFIEVHIDGDLYADALERVIARRGLSKEDMRLWTSVKRRLKMIKVDAEEAIA